MTDGHTSIEHGDPLVEALGDRELPSEGRLESEPAEEPRATDDPPAAKPKVVVHLTLAERAARGKAARAKVPRSARRSGAWSSTSTTSTRRRPAPGSGTSSAWRRASPSGAAKTASRARNAARSYSTRCAPTGRRWPSSRA